MAVNLTGLFGDVSNLASSVSLQDILQQAAIGAAVTIGVSGLKSADGQNALDPMHLWTHPASGTSGVTSGPVMPMSQFQKLSPDGQATVVALHYTIIPG